MSTSCNVGKKQTQLQVKKYLSYNKKGINDDVHGWRVINLIFYFFVPPIGNQDNSDKTKNQKESINETQWKCKPHIDRI